MEFKEFLSMYMGDSKGDLIKMSQFKRDNLNTYMQYRQRIRMTEDYYNQNRSKSVKEGKSIPELTTENFAEYEKYAKAAEALMRKK